MKKLGLKRKVPSDVMFSVYKNIENYVSSKRIDLIEEQALNYIHEQNKKYACGYAWSGGKDSIVLAALCDQVSVMPAMALFPQRNIWWQCNLDYFGNKTPANVDIIVSPSVSIERYAADLRPWLFNPSVYLDKIWFSIKWKFQHEWTRNAGLGAIFMGRRTIDGNNCGKDGITTNKKTGTVVINPIYKWSHEDVFGYMHYRGLTLPPSKHLPGCFNVESHWWPDYPAADERSGWEFMAKHDLGVIGLAAPLFPLAASVIDEYDL